MILDITEEDIRRWALDCREAEGMLPDLLRRLVSSVVGFKNIREIHFPAYKAVSTSGYDGWLSTTGPTLFSELEKSAWEISVQGNPTSKANRDYRNRTKNVAADQRQMTTYIAVTARTWSTKEKWIREKKALDEWGDVRAYDASDLATWLSSSVATSIWFSEKLGKYVSGIITLESYIAEWTQRTAPPLRHAVILSGRRDEASTVRKWLLGPPSVLRIRAETVEEATLFVSACLMAVNDEDGGQTISDAVVVDTPKAWTELCRILSATSPGRSITIIPAFAGFSGSSSVPDKHRLVVPYEIGEISVERLDVMLRPINREKLAQALSTETGDKAKAEKLANESGGKITSLQRILGFTRRIPEWVQQHSGTDIVCALLLAGQWDPNNKQDVEVLSELSCGRSWDEILRVISALLKTADPPLRTQGQIHKWRSVRDAWLLLGPALTAEDIKRYSDVCVRILKKQDPRFTMPMEERYMACIHGKVLPESHALRNGVANTLAWLWKNSEQLEESTGLSVSGLIYRVVRDTLDADWRVWASLGDCLRAFAEASPEAFLEQLEDGLRDTNKEVYQLLLQDPKGSSSLFASCCHAELLWALETLAWQPDYYARVTEILVELSQRDPGGTYSNRPSETLFSLFDPLVVQTAASSEIRMQTLSRLVERHPQEGWDLVKAVAQRFLHGGMATDNARPAFRDWDLPHAFSHWAPEDMRKYWQLIRDMLHNALNAEPRRLVEMIEKHLFFGGVGPIFEVLKRNLTTLRDEQATRFALQTALRGFVHLEYLRQEKEKGTSDQVIQQAKQSIDLLNSGAPDEDGAWLFAHHPQLPEPYHSDYRKEEKRIAELREQAMDQIAASDNPIEMLIRCAELAPVSLLTGCVAGQAKYAQQFEPAMRTRIKNGVASDTVKGFIIGRYQSIGIQWLTEVARELIEAGMSSQAVFVMTAIRSTKEVRDWVEKNTEIRDAYWKSADVAWANIADEQDFSRTIAALLSAGRWVDAVDFAHSARSRGISGCLQDYLSILRHGKAIADAAQVRRIHYWDLAEVFKAVDDLRDASCTDEELAQIEVYYLPFLKHSDRPPKHITGLLKQSPELFNDMICQIYRRHSEPPKDDDNEEDREKKANQARTAREILRNWHDYPGADLTEIDERNGHLRTWCRKSRDLTKNEDREIVGLHAIGEVLARVPPEEDGIWPCLVARELLEEGHQELGHGMEMAKYNSRGVTTRGLTDGGEQERELAAKYRTDADKICSDFPRTAAFLRRIADGYEADAKRHDQDAEQFTDP